ncbi:MAG: EpsG family protein [Synergistaceae bacterium]|nr:EpsG family protein [Synergistaceae bacterium]
MIYIVVFMSSIFFAWLAERSKDKGIIILCSVISILIPSILGGLRAHGVGVDTIVYGRNTALQALNSPNLAYFVENNRTELGYKILTFYVMKTLEHENWCYFFYQLITNACVYIGLWKHRKIAPITLSLFVFFMFFYNTIFSIMRQGMAAAIVFMGFDNVEHKKYMKFTLYVIVAALFHKSAVLTLVVIGAMHYVTTSKNITQRILWCYATIIFMIVFRPMMTFLTSQISSYAGYFLMSRLPPDVVATNSFNQHTILFIGPLLMFSLFYSGASRVFGKDSIIFYYYNNIFILTYIIFINMLSYRALFYSMFISIFNFSSIPSLVKEKNLKATTAFIVITVLLIFWIKAFVFINIADTWPYRSIL